MSDTKVNPDKDDKDAEAQQPERTFTQSEVEAMIRGRLAKFSDYEEIKQERDELKSQGQSEQEKAVEAARKEAREEAMGEINSRLINAEARALAAESGWLYPQDAHRYIDPKSVTVNPDGTVDVESVKNALAEAVKDRPALVKSEPDVPAPDNAGIGVHAPAKPASVEDAWLRDLSGR